MFQLVSTRITDRIKRNPEQNDYDEYPDDNDDMLNSMIVYNDYDYNYQYKNCKVDEYEIFVQMGSKLFSGTDDKVEIRFYGIHRNISEWLELSEPILTSDGFERLSYDVYCVKTEKIFKKISMIGIRKFGTDDMMIDTILIWNEKCSGIYRIDQWIRKEGEYIFERIPGNCS